MRNKLLLMNIVVFFIVFGGCIDKLDTISFNKISKSISKFGYIKSNEEDGSILSELKRFGDIYIFNLEDSTTTRLTDDQYFEIELAWSPGGDKLLFGSTRDRNYNNTEPNKSLYPDIYVYNFDGNSEKRIKLFYKNLNKFMIISGLYWEQEGIYLGDWYSISLLNENGLLVKEILNLKDKFHINKFYISKSKKYLILSCESLVQPHKNSIGIYDISNLTLEWLPTQGKVLGLAEGDDAFITSNNDSLFSFNCNDKKRKGIFVPALNDTMILVSANFISNNKILFNAVENAEAKGMSIRDRRSRTYIGIYNLDDNSIYYPDKYNCEKDCLTPYYLNKNFSIIK